MSKRIGIAAAIWGASILLSRVIGLVREAVLGRVLGGGADADLYFLSFRLPDYLNYLLAGGALSIVFIPIFGAYLARDDEDGAWTSFSVIANAILVVLAVVGTAAWIAVPWVVPPVFAPGLDADAAAELTRLTRIVLPAQAFHLVGGLLSAALQARDKHALPALAPLVYTVGIIAGGLIGGADAGAYGFAWGVLAGSVAGPFLLPLIGCLQHGLRWRPVLSLTHPDLKAWLWRSLPIMLAFSIVAMDDMVLSREGSRLGEGAVATLEYAKKLMKVPMGVFGLAAGVATFPTLARLVAEGDRPGAYRTLAGAVRRMLVLAFGAQVVLTVAGADISRVIYGGRMDAAQHAAIGAALAVFCVALWAWAAQTLVARGFYALGKTWLPSLLGTGVLVLAYPAYWWAGRTVGVLGLATASSAAVTVYVAALVLALRREYRSGSDAADRDAVVDGYGAFALRAVPCVVAAVLAGHGVALALPDDLPALAHGAVAGGVAGAVYLGALLLVRLPEAREVIDLIWGRVARRLGRSRRGSP
ncbi:MAG: murein biosynthesis integral membrane protein MurJ [Alphaproteobacteria bacterium]|nr:murein biosynthesis integral membrane protein MurJ [Alphaproteobacteria bacterium]